MAPPCREKNSAALVFVPVSLSACHLRPPEITISSAQVNGATSVSLLCDLKNELAGRDWLVNENFTLINEASVFRVEKMMKDSNNNGYFVSYFNQNKSFKMMKLTNETTRLMDTPNAGGSSVESEALSFEMFKRSFNARLLKTEMEVAYFPEGGSITDYVVLMFDRVLGVSVTRAMKFDGTEFTVDDADALLRKKLRGIRQSSRNSLVKWHKQVLHVWLFDENAVFALLSAWADLELEIKTNTVLVMTLATNSHELFVNQAPKIKKKKMRTSHSV